MITEVVIKDYQSIHQARIPLGRLTVITGPTGAGKSGVIRALRLLAFNARGTSYVRHGTKQCQVAAGSREENFVAVISRGARGSDKYVLGAVGEDGKLLLGEEYTKLAGQVPSEVTGVLKLSELNFAGQFDRPFLLDASGSQVARVLGELTNVTIVFEAAREASRRKGETARDLKRAEAELASLVEQAGRFRTLKERRAAALEAGDRLAAMKLTEDRVSRLGQLYQACHAADVRLAEVEMAAAELEVPSIEPLLAKWERLCRLRSLQETLGHEITQISRHRGELDACTASEEQAHAELHALLAESGICPTCGRVVAGA